jgi:hypothetical protein
MEGMRDQGTDARQEARDKEKSTRAGGNKTADGGRKRPGAAGTCGTQKTTKSKKRSSEETSTESIVTNPNSTTRTNTTSSQSAESETTIETTTHGVGATAKRPSVESPEVSETAKRARLTQAADSDNVRGDDFGCDHLGIGQMITKTISTRSEFDYHIEEGNILHDNTCKGCKKPTASIDKEKKCPISKWFICYCEIGHTNRDDSDGVTCRVVFCYTCAMVQVEKKEAAEGGGGANKEEGGAVEGSRPNELRGVKTGTVKGERRNRRKE